jgi:acetyl-CoA C-acetyltransferase
MIEAAETVAREQRIIRERQDRFALESHRRAIEAADGGIFAAEIVPLGGSAAELSDEAPRRALSPALLARMPPLAAAGGTVTAGNSCQINDGAAAVLIVSEALHRRLGSPPGLVFAGAASAGIEPRRLGLAAGAAAARLRERTSAIPREIDAIELNEAFAAQVLATVDQLDLDSARLNAHGGALAYGHPYGASGALLVVRLFTRLIREPRQGSAAKSGLALIAAAGGVGTAALFRSLPG